MRFFGFGFFFGGANNYFPNLGLGFFFNPKGNEFLPMPTQAD
jgi:hypothetical protein